MKRSMITLLLFAFVYTNGSKNPKSGDLFTPLTSQNNANNTHMMVPANNYANKKTRSAINLFGGRKDPDPQNPKVIGRKEELIHKQSLYYADGSGRVKETYGSKSENQYGETRQIKESREYEINNNVLKADKQHQPLAIEIEDKKEKANQCAGCKQIFTGSQAIIQTNETYCCLWKLRVHPGCFLTIVNHEGKCRCPNKINQENLTLWQKTVGRLNPVAEKRPPTNIYAALEWKKKFLVHFTRPTKVLQIVIMAMLALTDVSTSYALLDTKVTQTYGQGTIYGYVALAVVGGIVQVGVPIWMIVKYQMIVKLVFMEWRDIKYSLIGGLAVGMILGLLIGGSTGGYFAAVFGALTSIQCMGRNNRSNLFLQLVYAVYMFGPVLQLITYLAALVKYGDSKGEAGHVTKNLGNLKTIIM